MRWKIFGLAAVLFVVVSSAFAAPDFTVIPGGVQGNNWVWTIDVTPDLTLVPDSSGTPLVLEFGFRLTGAPLLDATIANPLEFDTPLPSHYVFGWETRDPPGSDFASGLQVNTLTGEIFAAYGSVNFTLPGPKHFLTITASGPSNGGPSLSSTIQWLGVFGPGSDNGEILQINGGSFPNYTTGSYYFSGSATQSVPEPAGAALVVLGAIAASANWRRRRAVCVVCR